MPHLPTDLRNMLEKAVVEARDVADLGARAAVEALGVGDAKVPAHLKPEEKELRVRLRARARLLGDALDAKTDKQAVDRLVREVAYEHWHRMLFARFLAESHLLLEPVSGVAVSLDEVRQLARESSEDPWALAGRFAGRMLPAIFRSNDPALALALPPERLNRLEALIEGLPAEVFAADDALGWVYQFWQTKRKKEVNASGRKIGADDLPAVTQLFTEPYMVQFLVHNTLGAWHAGKVLAERPELATSAASEDELRRACALPGYTWTYLRFVRDPAEGGPWRPAAGTYPGWPRRAAEITFLDPCCGSGHFLVEAFAAFVALRQHEEGLDTRGAISAVLSDNLHGLEIDPRCTQIAAFAVALAAWRGLGRVEPLPPVQIACSGLAVGVPKSEWLKLAGEDPELRRGMEQLHALFHKAPTLGSLLDPRKEVGQDLFTASLDRLEKRLIEVLGTEEIQRDAAATEVAVAAAGMALAVERLLAHYTLIATNVPYLGRKGQDAVLSEFAERRFPDAKADLATIFVARLFDLLSVGGTVAVVTPQNWQFLTSYTRFRTSLLQLRTWNLDARLGPGAFETITGEVVNVTLVALTRSDPAPNSAFYALDAAKEPSPRAKAEVLAGVRAPADPKAFEGLLSQKEQLDNPDSIVVFGAHRGGPQVGERAFSIQGLITGDYSRFGRCFWELPVTGSSWSLQLGAVTETLAYGGREHVVLWEDGSGALARSGGARVQGLEALGRRGIAIGQMRELPLTLFDGSLFDNTAAVLIPREARHLPALWAFCETGGLHAEVRRLNFKLNVDVGYLEKVPFDLGHWEHVARERYPNGLPEPWSEDPTQWIFHGHPARSTAPLQIAVARLVGYRWPAEFDAEMRLSVEAREWVKRSQELLGFADRTGIVCLSSLRGEEPGAVRLRRLLAAAFGEEWGAAKERELVAVTPGRAASLEEWLRDAFFEEHCALFHQRPFVWHLWDGRKDGFHALVNYHRLAEGGGKGRQLLESLAFAYLGEWIDRQRRAAAAGETGAEARLAAALGLQGELRKIIEGKEPNDLFVRWKPLHRQPIGWEPDIDDGVRLNARPFLLATLEGGRQGAGLFRAKPNIHWRKDRGVEPTRELSDFPWFYDAQGRFNGERHNDLHLTLDEKRRTREAKSKPEAKH
jgi:hypothetical protein